MTARAPGRVNLIGEHLDYNGGWCLPIAISRGTQATATARADGQLRVTSAERRWIGTVDDRPEGWALYVVGVLAALGVKAGLDLDITSDLPIGAGLSSSAALECSVALAVNELLGLGHGPDELAAACVRAETDYVGAPTGGMDQAAALFAAPGHALLIDFAQGTRTQVPFDPGAAGLTLVVIDTGVTHQHASGEYAARRGECDEVAAELGLTHLAAASYDDLARVTSEVHRRRARHVVTEQLRVAGFAAALVDGDWAEAGRLMTASHLSLRDDFEVSCAELDVAVAGALAAGALGARMTGGGFGGSALALVGVDQVPEVIGRVELDFAHYGWDAPTQIQVEASAGGAVLAAT